MGTYLAYMSAPLIIYTAFEFLYNKPIISSEYLRKRYLIICGFVVFFMIACMDKSVGSGDAIWYYRNWEYMSNLSLAEFSYEWNRFDVEKGYLVSVWILSHVFKNPQFIFVFFGALVAISLGTFLYKNCKDVVLGIVMFNCLGLWGFMVQGIRQGIAMCICLVALEYCKQRKLFKFIVLVVLATLFHGSAIVFLIIYILPYFQLDIKGYLIVGIGAIISVIFIEDLFALLNFVMNEDYGTSEIDSTSGGFVSLAIYCLIIFATLLINGRKKENSIETRLYFYMLCCGCILFFMRYSINTISQRVAYYFMFSQMPMLSMVIQELKSRDRALTNIIVVCLCFGIVIYKASYSPLVPYIFFWQS